ncbi:MAG: prephenate dehydrogenase [Gammaproteobacteria bacterium]|nr:MAG: prephenate dehydrogenase [Gammaproteobacteria bacterium]
MIGGSLAGALKAANWPGEIVGVVRNDAVGERGIELGYIDRYSTDLAAEAARADIIMLAVPMLVMGEQLAIVARSMRPDAIVTDAGSCKGEFVEKARAAFDTLARVVPGHPIAGRERTGIDAADPALFRHRRVILTPVPETAVDAEQTVKALWETAGASVEALCVEYHDRVLAATSHLPHMVAFALVHALADRQEAENILRHAAGGFRDFTRIASSDPVMWRDVALTNRAAILESMDQLDEHMKLLRAAIDQGDAETIEAMFARSRDVRDAYLDAPEG